MPIVIGDYLKDTQHLYAAEHGCYLLWLMHYWVRGPLPASIDKLVSIGKLTGSDATSIAQALLDDFFTLGDDGMYHQKRADIERAEWQGKRQIAKQKAEKAAIARWGKDAPSIPLGTPPSNPQAKPEDCPSPSPSSTPNEGSRGEPPSKPTRKKASSPKGKPSEVEPVLHTAFKEWFDRYYRKKNSKPAPWDGREAGVLSKWLKANPTVTEDDWKLILLHRFESPVTHTDPLSNWIRYALAWLKGPARDFGRPMSQSGGISYDKGARAEQSVREHRAKHAGDENDGPGLGLLALPAAQPGAEGNHGRFVLDSPGGSDGRADDPTRNASPQGDRVLAFPRTIEAVAGDPEPGGKGKASG
jgi:uncharacterized protein YdaU (DUF1376 family)